MKYTEEDMENYEAKIASRTDGHYCDDWDGLAVNAWTPEYPYCTDFKKSWLGRVINWYVMWQFRLTEPRR